MAAKLESLKKFFNSLGKSFWTLSDWLKILETLGVFGEPHEQVREARI